MPTVYVSIGSNVDREHNIRSSVSVLREYFPDLLLSSVYETEALGFIGDPFYNLVVGFETEKSASEIIDLLHHVESQHGRLRGGEKFSSRTLDLDLLLYGQQVFSDQDIPRAEITRYEFVLLPLSEIAPNFMHPTLKKPLQELWDAFEIDHKENRSAIHVIEFPWD